MRLDDAEIPTEHQQQEEQYREAHAHRQSAEQGLRVVATAKQREQRYPEAHEHGDKKQDGDQRRRPSLLRRSGHCSVKRRRARVRTLIAIVGLLAIAGLCGSLAVWQWHRAAESRALTAQFASGAEQGVLAEPPSELTDAERFQRLEVQGSYAAETQFLLDNMLHDGMAGYHVLTPLELGGSRRWLIVNRGWVPAGDRSQLPNVHVTGEQRTVVGRLERLPKPGLRLGPSLPAERQVGATLVQYPTAAELGERLGERVYDYQLLLAPAEPDGFVRDWSAPVLPPARHLAYAGQWLVFALGALAAAVTISIKSSRLRP